MHDSLTPTPHVDASAFVDAWSTIWDGPNSNPELYRSLLHDDCPLVNPVRPIRAAELPEFMRAMVALVPDIRVVPLRWAATDDSVLIEWRNSGTLRGKRFEIYGADRYTFRDGKAVEGSSYFDPRPMLGEPAD